MEYFSMPKACVLLNTEIGSELSVLEALRKVEGVEEAHNLWGVYDVVASVRADTMDKLKAIINKKIEKLEKVNAKLTMIITETHILPAYQNAILSGT
jgi:DNA-binding Lrp family transcriptional regulator